MRTLIFVKGKASSKTWEVPVESGDFQKTLLNFLREKAFPIASSCSGQGKCEKCAFNGKRLSCEITVEAVLNQEVFFDYL